MIIYTCYFLAQKPPTLKEIAMELDRAFMRAHLLEEALSAAAEIWINNSRIPLAFQAEVSELHSKILPQVNEIANLFNKMQGKENLGQSDMTLYQSLLSRFGIIEECANNLIEEQRRYLNIIRH